MSMAQRLRTSEILLEQMTEEPEAVLGLLQPVEQEMLMAGLHRLAMHADVLASEETILDLSGGVYELVADLPALRRTLLPEIDIDSLQRQITLTAHESTVGRREHVQAQAAQIRNQVLECRQKLEEALREAKDAEEARER